MQKDDFTRTVLVHKNKMYRFAMSYLKDENDAQDVVQDVLVRLWETRDQLSLKDNLEAWCMTLTKNKALDSIKRVGRKMRTDLDQANPKVFSHSFSPIQVMAEKDSMQQISNIAKGLPENQRASFVLRDVEGYAYHEIADILNINLNQVKVNIFRARKAIKEKLETLNGYGL
jgi:RNA polymerase sigma-70 factor (ECF subfamily)